ncbi:MULTISPECIES: putative phage abortive infection protein [unclassified Endozoicomonas]|uniref:putative phage abortive infection protein n=1 Tax=unclassified Endozoicomonas TaxID=2644528 RepID=UPI003BB74231
MIENRRLNDYGKVKKGVIAIAGIALLCAAIAALKYRLFFPGSVIADHEKWGQFGDFFGGTLNPIFSLFSLLAILWTLIIQSRELSESTEAFKDQSKQIKKQSFEATFFSMINLNNENIKTIKIEEKNIQGREIFKEVYKNLEYYYALEKDKSLNEEDESKILKKAYNTFYAKNQNTIGHYIRTLNQIFVFIHDTSEEEILNSDKTKETIEKETLRYWHIIRAQLTNFELLILFYHSATQRNFIKRSLLSEKNIFDHIEKNDLLDFDLHKNHL